MAGQADWSDLLGPPSREKVKPPGPFALGGCLPDGVTWDLADVVRPTLAEANTKLTVVARISPEFEGDVAYGRSYDNNPWLYVEYNRPPAKPTGLNGQEATSARTPEDYVSGTRERAFNVGC